MAWQSKAEPRQTNCVWLAAHTTYVFVVDLIASYRVSAEGVKDYFPVTTISMKPKKSTNHANELLTHFLCFSQTWQTCLCHQTMRSFVFDIWQPMRSPATSAEQRVGRKVALIVKQVVSSDNSGVMMMVVVVLVLTKVSRLFRQHNTKVMQARILPCRFTWYLIQVIDALPACRFFVNIKVNVMLTPMQTKKSKQHSYHIYVNQDADWFISWFSGFELKSLDDHAYLRLRGVRN